MNIKTYGRKTSEKTKSLMWRQINGCVTFPDASYDGYTGVKLFKFPISPKRRLSAYPNVTKEFNRFKISLKKDIDHIKKEPFGRFKVMKMFLDNFSTGEKWDTKFFPEFPGRDKKGCVQYAFYDGNIVAGNYLSNNIYGFLCAALGISEKMSKFIAKIYSCGILEPLISGKLPNKKLIKFRDPEADQHAISSGYAEFKKLAGSV